MAEKDVTKKDEPIVEASSKPEISKEELEGQEGEQLPDREQMSLVNANLALPVNAAVAANVLSDGSIAYADAQQGNTIDQGNLSQNPLGGSGTGS
jgi:hypothetical protein